MFRFRKTIKILPGIKLNLSKSGVSTTIGGRGLSLNIGKKGTYANVSIPGTGISYREKISKNKVKIDKKNKIETNIDNDIIIEKLSFNYIEYDAKEILIKNKQLISPLLQDFIIFCNNNNVLFDMESYMYNIIDQIIHIIDCNINKDYNKNYIYLINIINHNYDNINPLYINIINELENTMKKRLNKLN